MYICKNAGLMGCNLAKKFNILSRFDNRFYKLNKKQPEDYKI